MISVRMMRLALVFAILCSVATAQPSAPEYTIENESIPIPPSSHTSPLYRDDSGQIWVCWTSYSNSGTTISAASFSPKLRRWSSATTVASVRSEIEGPPSVACTGSSVTIVWGQDEKLFYAASVDGGTTFSNPAPMPKASGHSPTIIALADGEFAVSWLERAPNSPSTAAVQLDVEVLSSKTPPTIQTVTIDACDRCPLSFVALADGGAILAYRAQSHDQNSDCHFVRLHDGRWSESQAISTDGWLTLTTPGTGPRISIDGGRVSATWFTGADREPRILVTGSPDAGDRFLLPLKINDGISEGTPDTCILHDGAAFVIWAEDSTSKSSRSLWLRRITPDYALQRAMKVADITEKATVAAVSTTLLSDYAGGDSSASILVIAPWANSAKPACYLVTIPESILLAAADTACHCAPAPSELVGFAIRGKVVARGSGSVTVSHSEIPGVIDEGETVYRIDDEISKALPVGASFLGRIERRDGSWRLYDVRLLGRAIGH